MKKILYLSANGYIGGAEKFILNSCKMHLQNNKYLPCILFFKNGEAVKEAKLLNIPHFVLKNEFKLSSPLRLLRAILEIRDITKTMNPEWVHTTMPYTQIVFGLSSYGIRTKVAWFQHGPVGGTLDKIASLFKSHLLLFNSQFLKSAHFATVPIIRSNEVEIIKLGVESANNYNEKFLSSKLRLGTSGRICSWKGFHLIVEALKLLKENYPHSRFSFSIAGNAKTPKDIEYENSLKNLVVKNNLHQEIKFIGHVIDIKNFYQTIDVFIHSSTIPEPFGLVVAEAMGQSCLVIGSNQGGVTDLIINGDTGLSFKSTTHEAVQDLYSILERLLLNFESKNLDEYKKIQKAGFELIKNQYSLVCMTNELEDLYKNSK
ncbi:MAG: glycosyltransferase family 4 protein [Bacteriovoracaceae bacterium]|nr:glycosyltransferase family 4 protein [Bacteriovoracaceae bacterium]